MILGEVREQSAGLLDDRQGELIAERHQRLVGLDLLAGAFGEHDRVLRFGNLGSEFFDILGSGQHARRGRNGPRIGRRCPGVHQRFRRNGQIGWAGRLPLRELAGADDALIERVDAARHRGIFDNGIDQVGRAARDAQVVDPLGARIELRLLAVGHRLSGDHHHGHAGDEGAVDTHGALQQARACMQQHALHPAGGQGVARGHVYGERFVPHIQELGALLTPVDLVGHGFPHGRPFGARRGQDVIDSELAESFDYGFAAVELVFFMVGLPESFF